MVDCTPQPVTPYAVVDRSRSPVLHVRVVGPLTPEGFEQYLGELEQAFDEESGRFGIVLEQGPLRDFSLQYIGRSREWLRWVGPRHDGRWACCCFVLRSRALRGALRAVLWSSSPPFRTEVLPTTQAAFEWSRSQLAL